MGFVCVKFSCSFVWVRFLLIDNRTTSSVKIGIIHIIGLICGM
jgi:hypothetical protein